MEQESINLDQTFTSVNTSIEGVNTSGPKNNTSTTIQTPLGTFDQNFTATQPSTTQNGPTNILGSSNKNKYDDDDDDDQGDPLSGAF